jgi:hypothetical protein
VAQLPPKEGSSEPWRYEGSPGSETAPGAGAALLHEGSEAPNFDGTMEELRVRLEVARGRGMRARPCGASAEQRFRAPEDLGQGRDGGAELRRKIAPLQSALAG